MPYCEEFVGLLGVGGSSSSSRVHGAGEVMVETGNLHRMAAVNTFVGSGAIWFGRQSNSRIDFVWPPRSLVAFVPRCVTFKGMYGQNLQHGNTKHRYDHFPFMIIIPMEFPMFIETPF